MPKGLRGERRPADVIGNAVHVMRIATGEIEEEARDPAKEPHAAGRVEGRRRQGGEAVADEAEGDCDDGGCGALGQVMKRPLQLLALALLFSACAASGTNFRWANLRQVQLGMTKAEVTQLMGRPYMVRSLSGTSAIASGSTPGFTPLAAAAPTGNEPRELWIWSYAFVGPTFQPQTKSATIGFEGGRVISVPSIPDEFQD